MNKLITVFSLIAVAGLSRADLRSELTAARKKQEKATLAKDFKGAEAALRETLTSDFKYIQGKKVQDSNTYIRNFTATLAMLDKVTTSSERIISLKESGSKGAGQVEIRMVGTMKDPGKKSHPFDWTGSFTEEYRKVGGKWKTSSMTQGAQKFLMDGKPVKM